MCDPNACRACAAQSATGRVSCPDHRLVERRHTDCTVEELHCPTCGHLSVAWWPNDQPPVTVLNPEKSKE